MNLSTSTVAIVVSVVIGFVGGFMFNGYRLETKYQAEKIAQLEATRAKEKEWQDTNDQLQEKLKKEKKDAEKIIASLRADVASGKLRFTTTVRNCTSSATRLGEARAELDPTTADDLLRIARDGDDAIRQLNYCIDAYNSLR